MKESYLDAAASSALFRGVGKEELSAMLHCLDARQKHYKKGDVIYALDDTVSDLGLVLSGSVFLSKPDYNGNVMLMDRETVGGMSNAFRLRHTPNAESPMKVSLSVKVISSIAVHH